MTLTSLFSTVLDLTAAGSIAIVCVLLARLVLNHRKPREPDAGPDDANRPDGNTAEHRSARTGHPGPAGDQ